MRIASVLFLFFLLSCSSPSKEVQNLQFSDQEFSAESCVGEECASVKITWPKASETEIGTKINAVVLGRLMAYFRQDTVFGDMESAANDFVKSFEEFKKDFPEAPGAWTIEIEVEKTYESDSLLSLKFSEFEFTGGAHPNSSVNYITFDKSNGNQISEDQFVLNQAKLLSMTEEAFRQYHEVEEGVLLKDDNRFFLPEEGFFLPNAIGYEGDSLKLTYIPYEIGPYVMGYTELGFSLKELEGIVKK
ncbi:DUF4163 domain-containing protein [Algoriphagus aestuarii]|nr:DUF4163 domain-containing protein [Algoriphagus aestuarii]